MDKIRACGVKCKIFTSSNVDELTDSVNEWMKQSSQAELIGPPQFQAGPHPSSLSVMIVYTEMPKALEPPAPCE